MQAKCLRHLCAKLQTQRVHEETAVMASLELAAAPTYAQCINCMDRQSYHKLEPVKAERSNRLSSVPWHGSLKNGLLRWWI